jgi:TonB family protein
MKLLLIIFILILALSAFGQEQNDQTSCHLIVYVHERIPQKSENGAVVYSMTESNAIAQATVIALNVETKQSIDSVFVDNIPHFLLIGTGEFLITVRKTGYKTVIKRVRVDCADTDEYNRASENILMDKGYIDEKSIPTPPLRIGIRTVIGRDDELLNVPPLSERPIKYVQFSVPYPQAARALRVSGRVELDVVVDEFGYVASISAVSGHPLLVQATMKAVLSTEFLPMKLNAKRLKTSGRMVFNFKP